VSINPFIYAVRPGGPISSGSIRTVFNRLVDR